MWSSRGRQCAAHMAKRPFKVTRLNIVVTKDMAEVILVLPLDGSLSEERGIVTFGIVLVTFMDKGLCTARSGQVRLSKGWFYLGSWEQLTHQLSPSAASYKMNCDFFSCYSVKMQLMIQKISKAIDWLQALHLAHKQTRYKWGLTIIFLADFD